MRLPKGRQVACILLLLNIVWPTKQASSSEAPQSITVTVWRGIRSSSDRVSVCSGDKSGDDLRSQIIASKSLNCSGEPREGTCGENGEFNGYMCTCKPSTPTYIASKKRCVDNAWLRRDCTFRFGSWRFPWGWTWNGLDDPPLSLHLDDGYGITGGFNASNREFTMCRLANVTALTDAGVWGKIDYDSNDIVFFVDRGYYHISWNTENLDLESKEKIRGKILKFSITCLPPEKIFHNDIVRDPTESCLTFKVTGNFTSTPDKEKSSTKDKHTTTLAIAIGVTFAILVPAGILLGVYIYRRRTSGKNIAPKFITNFVDRIT